MRSRGEGSEALALFAMTREESNRKHREYVAARYISDPVWAERQRMLQREYYRIAMLDPERKAKKRARNRLATKKWTAAGKQAAWRRDRYHNDVNFMLRSRVSNTINQYLRRTLVPGKRRPTQELVDWTIPQMRTHLELLWEPGMNWSNYGKLAGQWSIDHVVPQTAFDFTKPDEIRRCWALSNLRPMWHADNRKKGPTRSTAKTVALSN